MPTRQTLLIVVGPDGEGQSRPGKVGEPVCRPAGQRRDAHLLGGAGWDDEGLGLEPDMLVIGKSIAGGIPMGAYGLSAELADRALARTDLDLVDLVDMGGVGGTLAGNPLSIAATRATLEHVLTDDAFAQMN